MSQNVVLTNIKSLDTLIYDKPIKNNFTLSIPMKISTESTPLSDIFIQTSIVKTADVQFSKGQCVFYIKIELDKKMKKIFEMFDSQMPQDFNNNFQYWVQQMDNVLIRNRLDLYHKLVTEEDGKYYVNLKFAQENRNGEIPVACFDKNKNYVHLNKDNIGYLLSNKKIQLIVNVIALKINNNIEFTIEREISQVYIVDDLNIFDKNIFSFVSESDDLIDLDFDAESETIDRNIEMIVYRPNKAVVEDEFVFIDNEECGSA